MRSPLFIVALTVIGCGPAAAGKGPSNGSVPDQSIERAAETKIWVTSPSKQQLFSPGESFEVAGKFTFGQADGRYSTPIFTLLSRSGKSRSGTLSFDQVLAKRGEQGADKTVPLTARLRCPKKPGKYAVRATISIASKAKNSEGIPVREFAVDSPLVPIEVKPMETKK